MLQKDVERLILMPWTCEQEYPFLKEFVEVIQFLLALYCSVWQNATNATLIKNLARTMQSTWKQGIPINQLGQEGETLLIEIAQMHKARFLLTGHVTVIENPQKVGEILGVKVQVLLHDAATQKWALNHVLDLTYFEPHRNHIDDFSPVSWVLEELMRSISLHLIAFMNPENSYLKMSAVATFRLDTHYEALIPFAQVERLETASKRAEAYLELAEMYPQNALIHLLLGRQLKLNRKYVEAAKALAKAVSSPFFPQQMRGNILNELGSCVALSGDREYAIDHWINAIEADPTHVLAYMNITHAYEEMGQEKKAEYYLKQVLNYSPGDTRVYHALARLYSCQDKWEKALDQYKLQLLLEPSDPWCHNNIATCSLQQKNIDVAKKHFERARKLDPDGEAGQYAKLVLAGMDDENHMKAILASQ